MEAELISTDPTSLSAQPSFAGGPIRRWARLVLFGFEQLVLARLLERPSFIAPVTEALLHTKGIQALPPELVVTDRDGTAASWTHGFSAVYAALFLNLRGPDDFCRSRYAYPGPPFRAIYLWDSAFIAQIWKWWDAPAAFDILDSVLEKRDGARLQHFASEYARSRFTQPPLIAWSLTKLAQASPNDFFMERMRRAYPVLKAFNHWLFENRRLPNGLFAWAHPYESGVENAPRFSSRDESRLSDTRKLAAPDFCTYMVLQCEALAEMAEALGEAGDVQHFSGKAERLREQTRCLLWVPQEGLFFDRNVETGAFVRTKTIASLLPLWAGIPEPDQARIMLQRILEPADFNSVIPLPSVALSDLNFERDMWRGPVWLNTAYGVIQGLLRYDYAQSASDLAYRLCEGVYETHAATGRFYEFYDPTETGVTKLHRKRGNRWKKWTLGAGPVADFVGWTGLANTLVTDVLFGLRRDPAGLSFCPRFPEYAAGKTFSLAMPAEGTTIEIHIEAKNLYRCKIARPDGAQTFRARFGERLPVFEQRMTETAGAHQ